MKFFPFVFALLLFCIVSYAQGPNIVPNPSFEQYSVCPGASTQMSRAIGWNWYGNGTSDYFNICATNTVGVPGNFIGTQSPANGNGYAGLVVYSAFGNGAEYIHAAIPALKAGVKYEVSMSASLADSSAFATACLGTFFFNNQAPPVPLMTQILQVTPQIDYISYGVLSNKTNWVRLVDTFAADSAYTKMVIGTFRNNAALNVVALSGNFSSGLCYYYIDSVVVRALPLFGIFPDTLLCATDTFRVKYNVGYDYFNANNLFSLQLSDAAGSFSAPLVVGTLSSDTSGIIKGVIPSTVTPGNGYKLRIVSSSPADTFYLDPTIDVGVVRPVKPFATSNGPICAHDTLKLGATTSTQGVHWVWQGPQNYISTEQNPRLVNSPAGNPVRYIVSAILFGCMSHDTVDVLVNVSPSIEPTVNGSICDADTLKLNAGATQMNVSYSWTGPNAFSSLSRTPVLPAIYNTSSGVYKVVASLGNCSVSDSVEVTVKPLPIKPVITANASLCNTDTLRLAAATPTPGVSWLWQGPNSFTAAQQLPQINNPASAATGNYIVRAALNGCYSRDTMFIRVSQVPLPVTANAPDSICVSDTLFLGASPAEADVTYAWSGPGGVSLTGSAVMLPDINAGNAGSYVLTASRYGCVQKDTVAIFVKHGPLINATNNGPLCPGTTLQLGTSAFSPGAGYSWEGPGGYTSPFINPTRINFNGGMVGKYIIEGKLNGCSTYDTTEVVMLPTPATPTAAGNTPVCVGGDIKLTATGPANAKYDWTGPALFSDTGANPTRSNVQQIHGGVYTVTTEVNGCKSAPGSTTVVVNAGPQVGMYPNPGDTICTGWDVTFTATPQNAGANPTFDWYRNGAFTGNSGLTYKTNAVSHGDTFSVRMTSSACNTAIASKPVRMNVLPTQDPPAISIAATPGTHVWPWVEVTFKATTTKAGAKPGYQWKRNGADIPNGKDSILKMTDLKAGDTVCCVVTSNFLCAQPREVTSNCLVMNVDLSIGNQTKSPQGLRLYPNPTTGSFTLESQEAGTLVISNLQGQHIADYEVNTGINLIALPQGLPVGVYIGKLNNEMVRVVVE